MSKTIFNLEALVKVSISDKKKDSQLTFNKGRNKTFWRGEEKEGWSWMKGYSYVYSKEELEQGRYDRSIRICEGEVAYYPPNVVLSFAGGYEKKIEFDTYEMATEYGENKANKNIKVQLIYHKTP